MSSDLYVQSISRGKLVVKRRKHITGEVMICFNDPTIDPVHITSDDPVVVSDGANVTMHAIQRSNIKTLIGMGYLEVMLS